MNPVLAELVEEEYGLPLMIPAHTEEAAFGAALAAAAELARGEQYSGRRIVVLLPDSGNRYFSTDLYK